MTGVPASGPDKPQDGQGDDAGLIDVRGIPKTMSAVSAASAQRPIKR